MLLLAQVSSSHYFSLSPSIIHWLFVIAALRAIGFGASWHLVWEATFCLASSYRARASGFRQTVRIYYYTLVQCSLSVFFTSPLVLLSCHSIILQ